ncbi:hypothetical protein NLG97_g4256 [Lecanicillium saksenae]|uniref:Uncharacterized protein n=1 Tax=Lecanicillium saksenae TaxID=468837 RepID=A0ACC1QXJ5_9HYPO|nr:hypothetical protein NLG97_g4256 [Lecanicillium saksenae]
MAQPTADDPFFWDTDRVCKELCFPGAEWTNDFSAFEALLRENMMDGETLLTYDLTFSRRELLECLEITAARHQNKLMRKVVALQRQSQGFRAEKAIIDNDEQPEVAQPTLLPAASRASPALPSPLEVVSITAQQNPAVAQPPLLPTASASLPLQPSPPEAAEQNLAIPPESQQSDEHPAKRRRIAPIRVRDVIPDLPAPRMPGFEEPGPAISETKTTASASSSEKELSTAYLGTKPVAEESIVAFDVNQDSDSGSDTFQSIKTSFQPRGKTKAIYSMVKKYLFKNNRKVTKIQLGIDTVASSDGGQDILNFDDLESLDEDTLREIADEEEEGNQIAPLSLNAEQVEEIINEELTNVKASWEEKKLPKYERQAYQLWTHARKHGFLRSQAFEARKQADHYRTRLSNLTRDLREVPWATNEELRFQARILEQTACDKLQQEWLTHLFSLRSAPPRPARLPIQQRKRSLPKKFVHTDELSSSSEEEPLEDFIVNDEPAFARADSVAENHSALATASGNLTPPHFINNTPCSPPHSPASSTNMPSINQDESLIDLTNASDVEMEDAEEKMPVPTPLDPFTQDSLAEIGKVSPKVWANEGDRFRLAICILWRLDFERRQALFESLAQPKVSTLWEGLVDKAYERVDAGVKKFVPDAISDLTLAYLSFLRCKQYKDQRLANMAEKDVGKLEASREAFPSFCAFLMSIKDTFPQKNQIARLDEYDDELIELDGPPDNGQSTATPRKSKKKQIVLNKSALDLRERENRRWQEQEQRKIHNRATAALDAGPVDIASARAPRFIINESKADDQGFIYIHHTISPRIHDHQIEGVRFMWNHIVREEGERQGCLLAHTMGLGKTMQTITFLVALRESGLSKDPKILDQIPPDLRDWKVLVICPSGLVENWKDEFKLWAPKHLLGSVSIIDATKSPHDRIQIAKNWADGGGVLILGYTMFKSGFRKGDETTLSIDKIITENATVVIADEAHSLKNPKAKISQVAAELKTGTRIALTGSPLANNVEEYYAMINWVAPNFLGPLQEFRDMYATPIHQGLYNDSTNYEKRKAIKLLQVLKETAAPKVHRATIKACLKEGHALPLKEEFVISVPPTAMQRKLYDLYMQAVNSSSSNVSQANLFGMLNHLALICSHPAAYRKKVIEINTRSSMGKDVAKFPMETIPRVMKITSDPDIERTELSYKVELLNKILDQSSLLGDKVLVFSQSLATLDYLSKLFEKQKRRYRRLDGSTQISKRQNMIKDFNTGSAAVYLISTNAGGVGLNIHGANRVVIFDFKWNPVSDQQAIGRAYRLGQKKPVFVYRFVVAGSFEDDLHNKAVFKTQLASRVVDQKNVVSWSKRLAGLTHLIKDVHATNDRFDFKGKDAVLDHLLDHDDSKAILSIMSADTFEEEDETETLTAEERQEARSMVERHNLRMTDPEKYQRLMDSEKIVSNQRPVSHIASGKPNKDWFPERPSHAFEPPSEPSQRGPSQTTPTALASAVPRPIPGANTYYGNSAVPSLSAMYPSTLRSNVPVLTSNGPSAFSEASCRAAQHKFEHKLSASLTDIEARFPNCGLNGESKATFITGDIALARADGNWGFAADTLRWEKLSSRLGNRKLVLAIASGRVSGKFLGNTTEAELRDRLQSLENMGDDVFEREIQNGGRAKDPEVRNVNHTEIQAPQEEQEETEEE